MEENPPPPMDIDLTIPWEGQQNIVSKPQLPAFSSHNHFFSRPVPSIIKKRTIRSRYLLSTKVVPSLPSYPPPEQIPNYYAERIDGRPSFLERLAKQGCKGGLMAHQINNFNHMIYILLHHGKGGNTSDAGAGKTYVGTAPAVYLDMELFVVAPKTLLSKWARVGGQEFKAKLAALINYEALRGKPHHPLDHSYLTRKDVTTTDDAGNKHTTTTFHPTPALMSLIARGALFVFDEVQRAKDSETATAQAVQALIAAIPEKGKSKVLFLSKTPIDKHRFGSSLLRVLGVLRGNMYEHLSAVGGGTTLATHEWREMVEHAKSLDRRITEEILSSIYLDKAADFRAMAWFLYRDVFRRYMVCEMPHLKLEGVTIDEANGFYTFSPEIEEKMIFHLNSMAKALKYQEGATTIDTSGLAEATPHMQALQALKATKLVELTRQTLTKYPQAKVILFLNYTATIEALHAALKKDYKVAVMNGKTKLADRAKIEHIFNEHNHKLQVVVSNYKVGSHGIDLNDKHGDMPHFKWLLPDFSTIDMIQAMARGKRVDTKQTTDIPALTTRIMYINTHVGMYESRILEIMLEKKHIINQSLANQDDNLFPKRYVTYDINNEVIEDSDKPPEVHRQVLDAIDESKVHAPIEEDVTEEAVEEVEEVEEVKENEEKDVMYEFREDKVIDVDALVSRIENLPPQAQNNILPTETANTGNADVKSRVHALHDIQDMQVLDFLLSNNDNNE